MKIADTDPVMMVLAYPFLREGVALPEAGRLLLANGVPAEGPWEAARTNVWQWWKSPAAAFEKDGFAVSTEEPAGSYAGVLVRVPRQRDEALFVIAKAWAALEEGGLFVAAAANDAGGGRLEKDLRGLLPGLQGAAKSKCRVVWCRKAGDVLPAEWAKKGLPLQAPGTGLWTQAGLFSWDRIDVATALLLPHIPTTLAGRVADLGCGTGIIAEHILKTNPDVKTMICMDADARAVAVTRLNLNKHHAGRDAEYHWTDLSQAQKFPAVDTVIMNPPFHTEKKQAVALGQAFIANAAAMLKPDGTLLMVANAHLPYEDMLQKNFKAVEKKHEGQGFKIFQAKR